MKFRIGSAVEAIRREHDPFGSWFPGTIISNDGDSYKIGYKFLKNCKRGPVIEKVHRDDVRPQPLTKARKWMIGDIIEVFNTWCWRVAEVAEMLQENWFVLRLLGGSHQLKEFHESDMRIRQTWHNNKWSIIGKVKNACVCLIRLSILNFSCLRYYFCRCSLIFSTMVRSYLLLENFGYITSYNDEDWRFLVDF